MNITSINNYSDFNMHSAAFATEKNCLFKAMVDVEHGFLEVSCAPKFYAVVDTAMNVSDTSSVFFNKGSLSLHTEQNNIEKYINFEPALEKAYGFYPLKSLIPKDVAKGFVLGNNWNDLGGIHEDQYWTNRCINYPMNCAKAVFDITREQAMKALDYISKVKTACEERNIDLCNYRAIGRNCVDFVTEAVKAAGIKENWFEKLEVERDSYPSEVPTLQAWHYVFLRTWGAVPLYWGRSAESHTG